MTGKESGHIDHAAAHSVPHINPDALEVAPGTSHENLEGWIPQLATDEEIRQALEKAPPVRRVRGILLHPIFRRTIRWKRGWQR
ncbi:MAG: hypothetical protein ACLQLC_20910 [Candidatus Sulfotelmatobacter sp.]